jgi:hypothetical protein
MQTLISVKGGGVASLTLRKVENDEVVHSQELKEGDEAVAFDFTEPVYLIIGKAEDGDTPV